MGRVNRFNKDPRRIQKRDFRCTVCGTVRTATKVHGKTGPGHVKTMFCLTCRDMTDHVQVE